MTILPKLTILTNRQKWILTGICISFVVFVGWFTYSYLVSSGSSFNFGTVGRESLLPHWIWGDKPNITFIEFIKTLAQLIVVAGVIITFYINIVNLEIKHKNDRLENTFKLIEKWDLEPVLTARSATRGLRNSIPKLDLSDLKNLFENNKPIEKQSDGQILPKKIEDGDEHKRHLITLFNYWRIVELSIRSDRVEPKIILSIFAEKFLRDYNGLNSSFVDSGTLPDGTRASLKKLFGQCQIHIYGKSGAFSGSMNELSSEFSKYV